MEKKIIKIANNGTISIVDFDDMKFALPYARKLRNRLNFFLVWDEDEDSTEKNVVASNVAGINLFGDAFVVKSEEDITGIGFDSSDCISCHNSDLCYF